jgi:hypothetical protein
MHALEPPARDIRGRGGSYLKIYLSLHPSHCVTGPLFIQGTDDEVPGGDILTQAASGSN